MSAKKLDSYYKLLMIIITLAVIIFVIITLTKPKSSNLSLYSVMSSDEEKEFRKCFQFSDYRSEFKCFVNVITSPSLCFNLYDKFSKHYDLPSRFCNSILAMRFDDYTICSNFDYSIGICLGEYATFKNNISICDYAYLLAKDNQTKIDEKKDCIMIFALHTKNYEVCNRITEEGLYGICIANVAGIRGQKEKCEELEGEQQKYCSSLFE